MGTQSFIWSTAVLTPPTAVLTPPADSAGSAPSLLTPPTAAGVGGGAEGVVEPLDRHLHHLPQRLVF